MGWSAHSLSKIGSFFLSPSPVKVDDYGGSLFACFIFLQIFQLILVVVGWVYRTYIYKYERKKLKNINFYYVCDIKLDLPEITWMCMFKKKKKTTSICYVSFHWLGWKWSPAVTCCFIIIMLRIKMYPLRCLHVCTHTNKHPPHTQMNI